MARTFQRIMAMRVVDLGLLVAGGILYDFPMKLQASERPALLQGFT